MKILFVNLFRGYAGGGEVYFRRLVQCMQEECAGVHQLVLASPANREMDRLEIERYTIHGIDGKSSVGEIVAFFKTIVELRRCIRQQRPDRVVINGDRASYIAPFLPRGISIIGVKHMPINTVYKAWLNRFAFRSLWRMVCISGYHRANCIEFVPQSDVAEKCHVIHNSVDTAEFPLLPLPVNDKVVFLELATLCARKGQMDALQAFARMPGRERAELWFAGEGEDRDILTQTISSLGLDHSVKLLGHRSDILNLYRDAHVVILPSYEEGMPLSLLEGMSCGRPVIATPVAGVPEMIADGREGYLVNPGAIDELAVCMQKCVEQRAGLEAMGLCGRDRVETMFSQRAWVKAWRNLLEQ